MEPMDHIKGHYGFLAWAATDSLILIASYFSYKENAVVVVSGIFKSHPENLDFSFIQIYFGNPL